MHRLLVKRFGPLDPPRRWDPVEELVLTVLSQNTSDVNSGRAFEQLRRRWPTWEALAAAPPSRLADAIRSGGLANVKAPRILAIGVAVSAPADTLGAGGEDLRRLPHRVDAAGLDRQPGHQADAPRARLARHVAEDVLALLHRQEGHVGLVVRT